MRTSQDDHLAELLQHEGNYEKKIFFVGFHKTATRTISKLLKQFKVKASHNIVWMGGSRSHSLRHFNQEAFLDGEHPDFRWLDTTFPGSIFVLNTRPLQHWLKSRWKHQYVNYACFSGKEKKCRWHFSTVWHGEEDIACWVWDRDSYHNNIQNHFHDRLGDSFFILDVTAPGEEAPLQMYNIIEAFYRANGEQEKVTGLQKNKTQAVRKLKAEIKRTHISDYASNRVEFPQNPDPLGIIQNVLGDMNIPILHWDSILSSSAPPPGPPQISFCSSVINNFLDISPAQKNF